MSTTAQPLSPDEIQKIRQYILDPHLVGNGPLQAVSPSFTGIAAGLTGLKVDESGVTLFGRKIWDTPWSVDKTTDPKVLRNRLDKLVGSKGPIELLQTDKATVGDLNTLRDQIKILAQKGSLLVDVADHDKNYNRGRNNEKTLADTRSQMQYLEKAMKDLADAIG